MTERPFNPKWGGTFVIANGTTASADSFPLDPECAQIVLYNDSATAKAFVRVTTVADRGATGGIAPTITTDLPVPPGAQIRVTTGLGNFRIRSIASEADGNLYVTPGNGD